MNKSQKERLRKSGNAIIQGSNIPNLGKRWIIPNTNSLLYKYGSSRVDCILATILEQREGSKVL